MPGVLKADAKIYVAGHQGLVGSALMRTLSARGYKNIVTASFDELDLRNQVATDSFFKEQRPDLVFVAAARVGGIKANSDFPASFIYDNVMIASNVMHAAYTHKVEKLLFLGSSCIYPRLCPQPMKEEYLLSGPLEPTNEWYALAKITGLKLCQAFNKQYGTRFVSAMPTNLYGPGDTFDLMTSHVIPALIAKFHDAKAEGKDQVVVWGSGTPRREFLYVDDLANALLLIMDEYEESLPLNVGTGIDVTIAELAQLIKEIVGFKGTIIFDSTKPDGTPRKLLDVSRIQSLGWHAHTSLRDGLAKTYASYQGFALDPGWSSTLHPAGRRPAPVRVTDP